MSVSIDRIEDALADKGMETEYHGGEDFTSFTIVNGSQTIELLDAVSGDSFRSEDLTEAIFYTGRATFGPDAVRNATPSFESVETLEEFLTAVDGWFNGE